MLGEKCGYYGEATGSYYETYYKKYENYCERKREKENKNSKVETEKTYACKLCI